MYLGNLIRSVKSEYKFTYVNNICFDSRKAKKNDIFFAIKGSKTSGENFINDLQNKKIAAIVINKKNKLKKINIPIIKVHDVRRSLAEASSRFYKNKPLRILAVTGTNGKTSIANFFFQILTLNKISSASIGTLGVVSNKFKKKTNLTTMDPIFLHKNLETLSKKNINNVIIEASSHGLDQKRLDFLDIKVGIFTNISHDHLDYHKNMKSYFKSKMYLFEKLLTKNSKAIISEENKESMKIRKILKKRKIKINLMGRNFGMLKILNNYCFEDLQIVKISYKNQNYILKIPLIGFFQVKNLLAAILAASYCGLNVKKAFKCVNKIKPIPGRLECVANLKNKSKIIIDYAHTPSALQNSLEAIKHHYKKNILLVFGCGGERDKFKRQKMGKIAKKYCRKLFVTDDNPRNENAKLIRQSIIKSCKNIAIDIPGRKQAIKSAIDELRSNEILLVAGKGHEQFQDLGKNIIRFSDKEEIKKIIRTKGFNLNKKKNYYKQLSNIAFNKKELNLEKVNGVSINSRTTKKNNIFFAVRGKKNDGHQYLKQAEKKGAIKFVVSKKIKKISYKKIIKVKNTLTSLTNYAKFKRQTIPAKIIGITGSSGKTTLKDLASFTLNSYGHVHFSPKSYNNKFGVPLSIANMPNKTNFGIFELGMSTTGEISKLSKTLNPDIGVITNIGKAHIENFKNISGIAKAKSEIIENIRPQGIIILNKDDFFFKYLFKKAKRKKLKIITFGIKKKSDIHFKKIIKIKGYYKLKVCINNNFYFFNIESKNINYLQNILACIGILKSLNLNLKKIKNKFKDFKIPEGRGDINLIKKFDKKFILIDESYNSNPLSIRSAIRNLDVFTYKNYKKKYLLIGDMLELGKKSKKLHYELSNIINKTKIDKVFAYGNFVKETYNSLIIKKRGKIFADLNEAKKCLSKILGNNAVLMIKGSNATGLYKFSRNLKNGKISAI